VIHRAQTFYGKYFEAKKPDMQPHETLAINKGRGDFNLSNKFEYGMDITGGIKSCKNEASQNLNDMKSCLE